LCSYFYDERGIVLAEKTERIESVDVFRLIAIVCVIMVHSTPFEVRFDGTTSGYIFGLFRPLIQFAVPFFFVISGYFWGVKIRNGGDIVATSVKIIKRLCVIFIVWSLVYILPHNLPALLVKSGFIGTGKFIFADVINAFKASPINYIFQGSSEHLWFLPSLLCAIAISSLFISKGWIRGLIVFALGLYVFCMLTKTYSTTPFGIDIDFMNTRNGPFVSTIFFVTGCLLSKYRSSQRWLIYGGGLFLSGYFVWYLEVYFLSKSYAPLTYYGYIVGTYFMGVGAAIAALSNHPLVRSRRLAIIGRLTLGIYVSHGIFVSLLKSTDARVFHPAWEIGYVFIVLVLAIITTYILSKNKYTRKIVM
jgi:surface polysaccharide O-acyltransferase-like enzyme